MTNKQPKNEQNNDSKIEILLGLTGAIFVTLVFNTGVWWGQVQSKSKFKTSEICQTPVISSNNTTVENIPLTREKNGKYLRTIKVLPNDKGQNFLITGNGDGYIIVIRDEIRDEAKEENNISDDSYSNSHIGLQFCPQGTKNKKVRILISDPNKDNLTMMDMVEQPAFLGEQQEFTIKKSQNVYLTTDNDYFNSSNPLEKTTQDKLK
jgi:hypothetical protein